jgi:hypothetical protein
MSSIEQRFWELCDRATHHDDARSRNLRDERASEEDIDAETRATVRAMVDIVHFVEANPEHRDVFVRCFCDLVLGKRQQPFDLVAFCMRRLRFPEIPELIRRDADGHKGTAYYANHMTYWSEIGHAYSNEVSRLDEMWESAESANFSD